MVENQLMAKLAEFVSRKSFKTQRHQIERKIGYIVLQWKEQLLKPTLNREDRRKNKVPAIKLNLDIDDLAKLRDGIKNTFMTNAQTTLVFDEDMMIAFDVACELVNILDNNQTGGK